MKVPKSIRHEPLLNHSEDFPLADEDNEDDQANEDVVSVGVAPELPRLRIYGADNFQEPVDAHHDKQLHVER